MAYTYYIEVQAEEHMLFTSEIAIKYNLMHGDKPRVRLVSNILRKHIEKYYDNYIRKYYSTRYGVREVFSREIYEPAMELYLKEENK